MTAGLELLQWALILGIGAFGVGLLYLIIDLQRRLGPDSGALVPSDGLAIGAEVPDFKVEDRRSGEPVRMADYAGQRVIVAFLSPGCRPCRELVPDLNRFAQRHGDTPVVVVAMDGVGADYERELSERITVVGDARKELQRAFEVNRTPLVYLVDEERRVANRTVSNSLVDLEDTLDGFGRRQGNAAWVPEATPGRASRDGDSDARADSGSDT